MDPGIWTGTVEMTYLYTMKWEDSAGRTPMLGGDSGSCGLEQLGLENPLPKCLAPRQGWLGSEVTISQSDTSHLSSMEALG